MGRTAVQGTVYLLHFTPRGYKHVRRWTEDLTARLDAHRNGRGARLMEVIAEAGLGFVLARTWTGTRALERRLKGRGGHARAQVPALLQPGGGRHRVRAGGRRRRERRRYRAFARALLLRGQRGQQRSGRGQGRPQGQGGQEPRVERDRLEFVLGKRVQGNLLDADYLPPALGH